jgi:glycosyltransferase involved in cell wall biosynthesis
VRYKLSFIVIGKNVGRTIESCVQSIIETVKLCKLENYEIIYIDSSSKDETIKIVKDRFSSIVNIYQLKGYMNAAVGRNVGASMASGDVLFFIDGDMEINPHFLYKVYNENEGLKYDFVSGKLKEHLFNEEWKQVGVREDRYNITKEAHLNSVGGIFLIKAELFKKINGFRNELNINEDIDFSLRLAKEGVFLLGIPEMIAIHKTIEFNSFSRTVERFKKGDLLYSGLLLRKHVLNKYFYKDFIDREKLTLLLIASVLLSVFLHPVLLVLYPLGIFFKSLNSPVISYWEVLLGRFLDSLVFLAGVFFFRKQVDISQIRFERMI